MGQQCAGFGYETLRLTLATIISNATQDFDKIILDINL